MSRIIREAKTADIPEIMQVMEAAKKIMRSSGNMHQWGEGYPSEAVIMSDIEKDGGFVIEDGGNVVGYFAFLPSCRLSRWSWRCSFPCCQQQAARHHGTIGNRSR